MKNSFNHFLSNVDILNLQKNKDVGFELFSRPKITKNQRMLFEERIMLDDNFSLFEIILTILFSPILLLLLPFSNLLLKKWETEDYFDEDDKISLSAYFQLQKLQKFLCNVFKQIKKILNTILKYLRDLRSIFYHYHSFHFKNLDDYYDTILVNTRIVN